MNTILKNVRKTIQYFSKNHNFRGGVFFSPAAVVVMFNFDLNVKREY